LTLVISEKFFLWEKLIIRATPERGTSKEKKYKILNSKIWKK